jgi:tyrosine-protein kinase Etk/Wzc
VDNHRTTTIEPETEPDLLSSPVQFSSVYRRCAGLLKNAGIIWKLRRTFIKFYIPAVFIGTVLIFLIPKHYEAIATLMPPDSNSLSILGLLMGSSDTSSRGGSDASSAGGAIGSLLGLNSTGQLYVRALGSRTVADHIIQQFDLMNVYKKKYIEDGRKALARRTDIVESKKSGTIEVKVTDTDPNRAAAMAKAYVTELDKLMIDVDHQAARQEREVTAQRVQQAEMEEEAATKELAEFSSKNTVLNPDDQVKATVEKSAAIEGQLIAAQSDQKSLEALYTPNNQRVYSGRARIEELKKALNRANSAGLGTSSQEVESPSVRKLPLLGIQYSNLYRKVKVRETVLRVLTQEYELARIREDHNVSTVSVLDPVVVPTKKSFPPRSLFILLWSLLCFFAITYLVKLLDWWEQAAACEPWKALLQPVVASFQKHKT